MNRYCVTVNFMNNKSQKIERENLDRYMDENGIDISDESWTDNPPCKGLTKQNGEEIFFPDVGKPSRFAKAICAECAVVEPCLEYSVFYPEIFGIWAGLSLRERASIRKAAIVEEIPWDILVDAHRGAYKDKFVDKDQARIKGKSTFNQHLKKSVVSFIELEDKKSA